MLGQLPTVKDFYQDKSQGSEDLKWISLSTTVGPITGIKIITEKKKDRQTEFPLVEVPQPKGSGT